MTFDENGEGYQVVDFDFDVMTEDVIMNPTTLSINNNGNINNNNNNNEGIHPYHMNSDGRERWWS